MMPAGSPLPWNDGSVPEVVLLDRPLDDQLALDEDQVRGQVIFHVGDARVAALQRMGPRLFLTTSTWADDW